MRQLARRHPALAARILTGGLSLATAFGLVAVFAREARSTTAVDPARSVEVRIGPDVDDREARAALEAWIDGRDDLTGDTSLAVVDAPADTESGPS